MKSPQGWKRPFDEPIPLPRGRQLVTLQNAGTYITKLPKAEHDTAEWRLEPASSDARIGWDASQVLLPITTDTGLWHRYRLHAGANRRNLRRQILHRENRSRA
jgi:hypothetical protein